MNLNIIWFILVGILFTGYVILDGFDLGVGALHLFTKKDEDRRIMLNAIGPVWDGNQVWLVTGGGALFAAFPKVYATVCSGFYLAFISLLFALMFRALAIEFRGKQPMNAWRQFWDVSFSLSSVLSSLLIGIVLGNLVWGIPLTAQGEYEGSFLSLFHPYSLWMGVTTLALFMMHGSIYVILKTQGLLHDQARNWVRNTSIFFILTYVITTMATLLYVPHMTETIRKYPVFFVIPLLNVVAVANIPREIYRGHNFKAFLSSCVAIIALMVLFAVGMYPYLVFSNPEVQHSLTIYNASSSQKTLSIMGVIALLGMPLVIAYTISIYWIFRGKVKLDKTSY